MLDSEDDALGVPLAGGERVAVLIRRVGAGNTADTHCRRGSHAGNSPNASYPDAALDFDDDNHVIYEHEDPEAGDDTHSHGNFVRCNIRIFYTVVIDHGSLVGDGNVHPDHIDSGSVQADYALMSDGAGASSFEPINITDVEVIGNAWNHILDGLGSTHNIGEAFDILDDLRFVELEDTPSAITADECVQGNSAGNALVFGSCGSGGGGGTDDQTAAEVTVDTTNFSRNLTAADDSVQAALETIDGFTQYQGTWQQAAWPAGVIVRRSGIPYLSLVNNNTEIPTPSSTQWTGLSEGFIYRGAAPIVATNYNYGQVVLEPDTDVYYYFTSTISASVARADIATHANFQAISGETGHSPRVGSGNAFPTTPTPPCQRYLLL